MPGGFRRLPRRSAHHEIEARSAQALASVVGDQHRVAQGHGAPGEQGAHHRGVVAPIRTRELQGELVFRVEVPTAAEVAADVRSRRVAISSGVKWTGMSCSSRALRIGTESDDACRSAGHEFVPGWVGGAIARTAPCLPTHRGARTRRGLAARCPLSLRLSRRNESRGRRCRARRDPPCRTPPGRTPGCAGTGGTRRSPPWCRDSRESPG